MSLLSIDIQVYSNFRFECNGVLGFITFNSLIVFFNQGPTIIGSLRSCMFLVRPLFRGNFY